MAGGDIIMARQKNLFNQTRWDAQTIENTASTYESTKKNSFFQNEIVTKKEYECWWMSSYYSDLSKIGTECQLSSVVTY